MIPLGLSVHEAGAIPVHSATSAQDQSAPSVMGTVSTQIQDSRYRLTLCRLGSFTTEEEKWLFLARSATIRRRRSVSVEVFVANEACHLCFVDTGDTAQRNEPDVTRRYSNADRRTPQRDHTF